MAVGTAKKTLDDTPSEFCGLERGRRPAPPQGARPADRRLGCESRLSAEPIEPQAEPRSASDWGPRADHVAVKPRLAVCDRGPRSTLAPRRRVHSADTDGALIARGLAGGLRSNA